MNTPRRARKPHVKSATNDRAGAQLAVLVRDYADGVIEHAKVEVGRTDGRTKSRQLLKFRAGTGRYHADGLSAGSYALFVRASGLEAKGRASIELLERHSVELIRIMLDAPSLRKRAEEAITKLSSLLTPPPARKTGRPRRDVASVRLPPSLVRALDQLARDVQRKASPSLVKALVQVRADLAALSKQTLGDLLN